MQNYNNFMAEINALDVRTKEQFVTKDGRVIPDYYTNPNLYPVETDSFLHPHYYRATFLNLDHYREDNAANRYTDQLRQLMERAKNDVLQLPSEEVIRRIVADVKQKRERFTRLHKKAIEFKKAIRSNTLDDPTFLELQLLSAFDIPYRPEASPDVFFAENLFMVTAYKRGALSHFIKQIEAALEVDEQLNTQQNQPTIDLLNNSQTNKPDIRPFPQLLIDGYLKNDLDLLLIHLRMKKADGVNIWPQGKKSGLYGVIDALKKKDKLIETTLRTCLKMFKYSIHVGQIHKRFVRISATFIVFTQPPRPIHPRKSTLYFPTHRNHLKAS